MTTINLFGTEYKNTHALRKRVVDNIWQLEVKITKNRSVDDVKEFQFMLDRLNQVLGDCNA